MKPLVIISRLMQLCLLFGVGYVLYRWVCGAHAIPALVAILCIVSLMMRIEYSVRKNDERQMLIVYGGIVLTIAVMIVLAIITNKYIIGSFFLLTGACTLVIGLKPRNSVDYK